MSNKSTALPRAQWRSYYSYLLVTTGAIVGLGNIFNFPFLVAEFGGLFVLFYVISEIILSIPLLFTELVIGRRGKQNPVGAISILAMESGASYYWRFVGWLCFIILFLTLSYYTVAVAYSLGYFVDVIQVIFSHSNPDAFLAMASSTPWTSSFVVLEVFFLIFLVCTMIVIVRGINRGLEEISFITVPLYFLILFSLAIYINSQHNFLSSFNYLFHIPENQSLLPILFAALTFAFFKLNIGMGSMMVYGSYLPYSVPLVRSTLIIIGLDAVASLLSYFIICPLMLQSPTFLQGGLLNYNNIMQVFVTHSYGSTIAALFFFAAVIAAWTPTIAMAEAAALTLIERFQWSRVNSTFILSIGVIIVGTLVVSSFTKWSDIILYSRWTIGGFIKNFASDIATPISAFLLAIFGGWIVKRQITKTELQFVPSVYKAWHFLICYVAPILIFIILGGIGFS